MRFTWAFSRLMRDVAPDNFTIDTFADACAFAHLRGVNVYVTLNTAILPGEVDSAMETARQAYRAGADAFIVQDIGHRLRAFTNVAAGASAHLHANEYAQ